MKDLCERSGLPRQVVHFYIQQGLLAPGRKSGRNMAWYGDEHLRRLALIRRLQHERFLPLKAIRAMLDAREEVFSPAQRETFSEVRLRLRGDFAGGAAPGATEAVSALLSRTGVKRSDFDDLVAAGLLAVSARGRSAVVAKDDCWVVEHWAALVSAGYTRARGFVPADLGIYDDAVEKLFSREQRLMAERMGALSPDDAAEMLERGIPLINSFMAQLHLRLARRFFETLHDTTEK